MTAVGKIEFTSNPLRNANLHLAVKCPKELFALGHLHMSKFGLL